MRDRLATSRHSPSQGIRSKHSAKFCYTAPMIKPAKTGVLTEMTKGVVKLKSVLEVYVERNLLGI